MKARKKPNYTPPEKRTKKWGHDWVDLKKRFFAHEWPNVREMAKVLKMSEATIHVKGAGWHTERKARDEEISIETLERSKELVIQDRVTMIRDMQRRQLATAIKLQEKGSRRLTGKVIDSVSGLEVEREYDNDALAIQALRLGVQMEQSILLKGMEPGDLPAAGVLGLGGMMAPMGAAAETQLKLAPGRMLKEYSSEELQNFLNSPDALDDQGGPKKTSGPGAAGS